MKRTDKIFCLCSKEQRPSLRCFMKKEEKPSGFNDVLCRISQHSSEDSILACTELLIQWIAPGGKSGRKGFPAEKKYKRKSTEHFLGIPFGRIIKC